MSGPSATIRDFSDGFDRIIEAVQDPLREPFDPLPQSTARDASDILHRAEARFPQEEAVHRAIGWAFLGLDDPRAARAAFEKARSLVNPGEIPDTSLLAGLSVAFWLLEDKEQAINIYRALIETGRAQVDPEDWADSETLGSFGFDPRGSSGPHFRALQSLPQKANSLAVSQQPVKSRTELAREEDTQLQTFNRFPLVNRGAGRVDSGSSILTAMQTPPPIPVSPSHTLEEFVRATTQQDKGHGLFEKETERLLEVNLNGRVNTKMGSMVAYQGISKEGRLIAIKR